MKPVILIGAGGHAKVVLDTLTAAGRQVVAIVDKNPDSIGGRLLGVPIIGDDAAIDSYGADAVDLALGLGNRPQRGDSGLGLRRRIQEFWTSRGYGILTFYSPFAYIAPSVQLGTGVQVMAGAVIQADTYVGSGTIVNSRTSIDHDCIIGDHCHIAPGAVLCGGVRVFQDSHIGAGAIVLPDVTIGRGVVVAAGAVVRNNVSDHTTFIK